MSIAAALSPPEIDPLDVETPDGFELIDGRLVEKYTSFDNSRIATRILGRLINYAEKTGMGEAIAADGAYRCFPNRPRHSRKPDATFIRRERLPEIPAGAGDSPVPPDLVVEVLSRYELATGVNSKVRDFRSVGVPLIWVIDPENRMATVNSTESIRIIGEQDELSGGDVLPGFRMKLADVLLPPNPSETSESP